VLQQPPREMFPSGFFLPKELAYQLVCPRHNGPNLRINFLRCLLAVRSWPCRHNARQERRGRLIVAQQTHLVTHAIGCHHGLGHVGDFAQVVVGSRGNIAKHQLFGDPATEQHSQPVEQCRLAQQIAIFGGLLLRIPQGGNTPRHNGHFAHRIGLGQGRRYQRMAGKATTSQVLSILPVYGTLAASSFCTRYRECQTET